jgi:hypothetical protein
MGTSRPGTVLVISPILEGKSNAVVLHCCCRFIWFPVGPPLKGVEYFFLPQVLDFFLPSFPVPFALYLQQFGTRTCHFAWYLLHFGTFTFHFAW